MAENKKSGLKKSDALWTLTSDHNVSKKSITDETIKQNISHIQVIFFKTKALF